MNITPSNILPKMLLSLRYNQNCQCDLAATGMNGLKMCKES